MKCPKCQRKTIIRDTRKREGYIYRRRECLSCRFRFTTGEHWISQIPKGDVGEFRYPVAAQDLSKILTEAILGADSTDYAMEESPIQENQPKELVQQDLLTPAINKLADGFVATLGRYCKECYSKLDESNLFKKGDQICKNCKEVRFGKSNEDEEAVIQIAELAASP